MSLDDHESFRVHVPPQQANNGSSQDHYRERDSEQKDGNESKGRQDVHIGILERALTDPDDGLNHDRQHRRFNPEEKRLHQGCILKARIKHAQHQDAQKTRQHKQSAGHEPTLDAMQQPADISSQLLGFRPGQYHAVVQGVQKPAFADPSLFIHQNTMHDGDLAGRTAETQHCNP